MTATRPDRRVLEGRSVQLEPFAPEHIPGLWTALGHPEVFAGGFGGGPAGLPADVAAFTAWIDGYLPYQQGNCYVVRVATGPDAGAVIGTSSLSDFVLPVGHAHIGWTAFDPRVWGTAANPETKLLLLTEAFEHGFGRVRIQADVLNARSRAAISKLGATFEGVMRRDKQRADGSWRDTAVFSVIIDDWPAVRTALEARLEAFAGSPIRLAPQ